MTLVVNLFGGPGTGKSSTMAGLFAELKWRGINCEMAPEFAKDKVWEESFQVLDNQVYIFGKQYHRIARLMGKVDVIVTDSPLLLSLVYGTKESQAFRNLVLETHNKMYTFDVFLGRQKDYVESGRMQTEEEALTLDTKILTLFGKHGIEYRYWPAKRESVLDIADTIETELRGRSSIGSERRVSTP